LFLRDSLGAISNVPYLTPQDLPEGEDCRPLFIPAGSEWLALFGGALTELTKTWNWEDSGGLSIEDTIDKMAEIIQNWYDVPCAGCELPGGGAIIRINAEGHLEQLIDGEWVTPEGDYLIPPPAAREGGTEDDQLCLAAANATNVLKQLYENLSDSYNDDLDQAEAVFALTEAFAAIVGFAIAPITYGILAFATPLFVALFAALEYAFADLWTEEFDEQIQCFLYDCGTNTEGVVTFDWDCFVNKLHSLTNNFSLTEDQLRLYGQLSYMLWFIGGVDGLNLAGATTAITSSDCGCAGDWCFTINLMDIDGDFVEDCAATGNPYCAADWVFGSGWEGWSTTSPTGQSRYAAIALTFPSAAHLTRIVAGGRVLSKADLGDNTMFIRVYRADTTYEQAQQFSAASVDEFGVDLDGLDDDFVSVLFVPTSESDGISAATGTPTAQFITFYGTGERPAGWFDNCID